MTKARGKRNIVRITVPDSHGSHIDAQAANAFLKDLKRLDPDEIVMMGDHLDAGGVFSSHARAYTNEMTESYDEDCQATNWFLDEIQKAAPRAKIIYLEGNHEARVAKWATCTFLSKRDADAYLERMGPKAALELKRRGIRYVARDEFTAGCSIPGTVKLSINGVDVFYTHGIVCSMQATAVHLAKFGANVEHGHTHRAAAAHGRTVAKGEIAAWCAGTLAKIQPLYLHTNLSQWAHGYGVKLISSSGLFIRIQVPLVKGQSMLDQVGQVLNIKRGKP